MLRSALSRLLNPLWTLTSTFICRSDLFDLHLSFAGAQERPLRTHRRDLHRGPSLPFLLLRLFPPHLCCLADDFLSASFVLARSTATSLASPLTLPSPHSPPMPALILLSPLPLLSSPCSSLYHLSHAQGHSLSSLWYESLLELIPCCFADCQEEIWRVSATLRVDFDLTSTTLSSLALKKGSHAGWALGDFGRHLRPGHICSSACDRRCMEEERCRPDVAAPSPTRSSHFPSFSLPATPTDINPDSISPPFAPISALFLFHTRRTSTFYRPAHTSGANLGEMSSSSSYLPTSATSPPLLPTGHAPTEPYFSKAKKRRPSMSMGQQSGESGPAMDL